LIQVGEGFVEEQGGLAHGQDAGDDQPLFLACGEAVDGPIFLGLQVKFLQDGLRQGRDALGRGGEVFQAKDHFVVDGIGENLGFHILQEGADAVGALANIPGFDILALAADGSGESAADMGGGNAGDAAQQSAFAAAGGPCDQDNFARLQGQVNVPQYGLGGIGVGKFEIFNLNY